MKVNLTPSEVKILRAVATGDSDLIFHSSLYDKLFEFYLDSGEMPYGVAKARTGEPDVWITEQLDRDFESLTGEML